MQVSRWGNSLAVRIPAAVAEAMNLREGDDLEIEVAGPRTFASRARVNCWRGCAGTVAAYRRISVSTAWKPMSAAEHFIDTNVLLYLLSAEGSKADRAEEVLALGGTISVQVLNEFAAVATRKLRLPWSAIGEILETLRAVCTVVPLTEAVHVRGMALAQRYGLSVYDAMIAAAALESGCRVLLSEDLQHGQVLDGVLRLRNPFLH